MIGEKTLELLKQVLAESSYTVAICGSGMMEEGGILGLKQEGRAYEIEQKYSESPEELFHISCLSRRPERFYEFYREEILKKIPDMTPSVRALARMEEEDKLQCIVTTNIFDLPEQVGCRNVIYLHGSIYKNRCPHCGRLYSMEEIRDSRHVPHCKNCKTMIRPGTSLRGDGGQQHHEPYHGGDSQGRRAPGAGNQSAVRGIQQLHTVLPGQEDGNYPPYTQAPG